MKIKTTLLAILSAYLIGGCAAVFESSQEQSVYYAKAVKFNQKACEK